MFLPRCTRIASPIFGTVGYTVILGCFTQIAFVTNFTIRGDLAIKTLWFRALQI